MTTDFNNMIKEGERKTCDSCIKLGMAVLVDGKCAIDGCLQSDRTKEWIILEQSQKAENKAESLKRKADVCKDDDPEKAIAYKLYAEAAGNLSTELRGHAALHR